MRRAGHYLNAHGAAAGVIVIGLFLAFPVVLDSCAIGPPTPIFVTLKRPADVEGQFLKGRVGVVRPSLDPRYLIGAFRILSGRPLTRTEADALYTPTPDRNGRYRLEWANGRGVDPSAWAARRLALAADGGSRPAIQGYKNTEAIGMIGSFLNCNHDAYGTAAATLQSLEDLWGLQDGRLLSWVLAQDQVFANCAASGAGMPDTPRPGMDPLLAAHRRYDKCNHRQK